jgi:hypothetical protein
MPLGRLFKVVCAHCKRTIVPAPEKVRNPGVVWGVCSVCQLRTKQRLEEVRREASELLT